MSSYTLNSDPMATLSKYLKYTTQSLWSCWFYCAVVCSMLNTWLLSCLFQT